LEVNDYAKVDEQLKSPTSPARYRRRRFSKKVVAVGKIAEIKKNGLKKQFPQSRWALKQFQNLKVLMTLKILFENLIILESPKKTGTSKTKEWRKHAFDESCFRKLKRVGRSLPKIGRFFAGPPFRCSNTRRNGKAVSRKKYK
jgi:hypothetical protein